MQSDKGERSTSTFTARSFTRVRMLPSTSFTRTEPSQRPPPANSSMQSPVLPGQNPVSNHLQQTAICSPQFSIVNASLTKQHLDDHVPKITAMVNTSLEAGTGPELFRQAVVITTIHAKSGLDSNTLKNYKRESNVSFIL